jgi:hypothetical protein
MAEEFEEYLEFEEAAQSLSSNIDVLIGSITRAVISSYFSFRMPPLPFRRKLPKFVLIFLLSHLSSRLILFTRDAQLQLDPHFFFRLQLLFLLCTLGFFVTYECLWLLFEFFIGAFTYVFHQFPGLDEDPEWVIDSEAGTLEDVDRDSFSEELGDDSDIFEEHWDVAWIFSNGYLTEPSLNEIDELDSYHRQQLKLSEEEKAILRDEPTDIIKNLGILIALRSASEADPQSRAASVPKQRKRKTEADGSAADSPGPSTAVVSDKLNRLKGSTQRSTSVSSTQAREAREAREGIAVKSEEGVEGTKSTLAERTGQLVVGAEVVFKHNKKQQGVEGEGIQCIIKSISGEGHKKR